MNALKIVLLMLSSVLLSSCISNVWTGASLVYDRHNVYKSLSDFQLAANSNRALYNDKVFKRADCSIDLAVFKGDILLSGNVPTAELRKEAYDRIKALDGYRRLFDQLAISNAPTNVVQDNWITAKIRSQIIADSTIDPHAFKVVTTNQIVYLMGDVIPEEASKVIHLARECTGVKRVVKLFKYYNLSDQIMSKN